jgi:hypothetical protein
MKRLVATFVLSLLLVTWAAAQRATIVFCALDEPLDFKTAKAGDTLGAPYDARCARRWQGPAAARNAPGRQDHRRR